MNNIQTLIKIALSEDIGSGDVTTLATVPKCAKQTARLIAKQDLTVCGTNVAAEVFRVAAKMLRLKSAPKIVIKKKDATRAKKGDVIMEVTADAALLLTAERTALNFLQRLSGVASETAKYVSAIKGTRARILDTRKMTPGWRTLEKYAVSCGGGTNHRIGLFDMFLIKNNHVDICGSVEEAVCRAKHSGKKLPIEAEARDIEEMCEAIAAGADVIMLDNFSPREIKIALKVAKDVSQFCGSKPLFEASGGITFENIRSYAKTGVDFISVGAITHSAKAADICLRVA